MGSLLFKSLDVRGKDFMAQNQDINDESSTTNQDVSKSQEVDSNIEKKLRNWSIPKFKTNQVYKTSIFEFEPDYKIKTVGKSIGVQGSSMSIAILDADIVNQHVGKYRFLHIGLVQVAAKPLTRLSSDFPILICLRDKRLLKFHDSVLAVLESNLQNGPAYFNCFPSYPVLLTPCREFLVLDIKIPSEKLVEGIPPISIMYRFCYKVTSRSCGSKALRHYTANETVIMEANVQNSLKITQKRLKHDQITFPEEWLQEHSSTPKPQKSKKPPRDNLNSSWTWMESSSSIRTSESSSLEDSNVDVEPNIPSGNIYLT